MQEIPAPTDFPCPKVFSWHHVTQPVHTPPHKQLYPSKYRCVPGTVSCSVAAADRAAMREDTPWAASVARGHAAFPSVGHVSWHALCCSCSLFSQVFAVSVLKGWTFLFSERKEEWSNHLIKKARHMQGRTEGREAQPWRLSTKNERGERQVLLGKAAF